MRVNWKLILHEPKWCFRVWLYSKMADSSLVWQFKNWLNNASRHPLDSKILYCSERMSIHVSHHDGDTYEFIKPDMEIMYKEVLRLTAPGVTERRMAASAQLNHLLGEV